MSALGRWWGSGRRARSDAGWGSAQDVEVGPATPPNARPRDDVPAAALEREDDAPWFGTWEPAPAAPGRRFSAGVRRDDVRRSSNGSPGPASAGRTVPRAGSPAGSPADESATVEHEGIEPATVEHEGVDPVTIDPTLAADPIPPTTPRYARRSAPQSTSQSAPRSTPQSTPRSTPRSAPHPAGVRSEEPLSPPRGAFSAPPPLPPWRRPGSTPPWGTAFTAAVATPEPDDAITTPSLRSTDATGPTTEASLTDGHAAASNTAVAGSGRDMSTSPDDSHRSTDPTGREDSPAREAGRDRGDGENDVTAAGPTASTSTPAAGPSGSTPGGSTRDAPAAGSADPLVDAGVIPAGSTGDATPAVEESRAEPATTDAGSFDAGGRETRPPGATGAGLGGVGAVGPHAAPGGIPSATLDRHRLAQERLGIDEVIPEVANGRFASKAVVGEVVPVGATVWREGHDAVAATLVWRRHSDSGTATHAAVAALPEPADDDPARQRRMIPSGVGTDRVAGSFVPDSEGLWSFRVDAWSDPWATWRHAVEVKAGAGQAAAELANDLEAGARVLERGAAQIENRIGSPGPAEPGDTDDPAGRTGPIDMPPSLALATTCREAATALRDTTLPLPARLAGALSEPVHRTMSEQPVRELLTRGRSHHVFVERPLALAGGWYEFFPRSTGGRDVDGNPVHGTFATAARELERVAAMGFDVAYLPPIHPIGTVNRKGRDNTLAPGPGDVGSPWAIGSADGGHDAVHPALGTFEDFDAFVARARELGLEVALDLALQCAPDHPWAATHPEWFVVRPDGTIAYAENPPKKYQDIYPVSFETDPDGLYAEVLRVVLTWMDHGVRVFRVDNPHTKPPDFWAWLIAEIHRRDPGVVFLAEAFTRPARLFGLARAGFSQSYTYFTWRTGKQELVEFFSTHRDRIDECRPNCFVNTPDILHESLQGGGPGMFALRAALAATLSPSWGVYAGFELFEHEPARPGSEEYLHSEKYELRPRDFAGALAQGRSLEPWITRLNQIRRAHPALRQLRNLTFHDVDSDGLLAFSKSDPRTGDTVLCVITLDPSEAAVGTLRLDMPALGLDWHERFGARDEVSGEVFDWGQANYVRLEPWRDVAHVISVLRRAEPGRAPPGPPTVTPGR